MLILGQDHRGGEVLRIKPREYAEKLMRVALVINLVLLAVAALPPAVGDTPHMCV